MFEKYDLIVVGAGHAGCEASMAAANLGSKVLLITMNLNTIAQMSCNPAVGGIAKGQIVREIDALGGYMGIVSDKTALQFRMLNSSKGPAVWSPRTQNDKIKFSIVWRNILESNKNIDFWQDNVVDLIIENNSVKGVVTSLGMKIFSKSVVLTNGTFLNGVIHIGEKNFSGGRLGEHSSVGLTNNLKNNLGFEVQRMKTGTPVRVDGRTINFEAMEEQKGDEDPRRFSFTETPKLQNQRSCFLTYTNLKVHEILKTGFEKSPLFKGRIKGRGPRYCPSIEDKIERFADKDRHQLFVEPESELTQEYYINGFSSSLPEEIQCKALLNISGFEKAKIIKPGYAIEYDYFPPTQLYNTLETKLVENLYFAGQINGTTGYEEAGCQGLMAGINAHKKINNQEEFVLKRYEAYIGVLIDDLVTKGTNEPYRMFTSRAEYRILLRQDNADIRLTPIGFKLGLISEERIKDLEKKKEIIQKVITFVKNKSITPEEVNIVLTEKDTPRIEQKTKLLNLLMRPQISIKDLIKIIPSFNDLVKNLGNDFYLEDAIEEAEIQMKYDGYITKENDVAEKIKSLENLNISDKIDYKQIGSLSAEAQEKLSKIKPRTIGQASRISGVNPSDIAILIVYINRK